MLDSYTFIILLGFMLSSLCSVFLCYSVWPCVTPETAAHQVPLSLGFSRQEYWSGLPFPFPMHESEVAQWCPTLSNPMDCSLPGSSIHGIFQARVLEWGAIAHTRQNPKSLPFPQSWASCLLSSGNGIRLLKLITQASSLIAASASYFLPNLVVKL